MGSSRKPVTVAIVVTAVVSCALCALGYLLVSSSRGVANAGNAAAPAPAAPAAAMTPTSDLARANVHACLARFDSMSHESLAGTNGYRTASTWNQKSPDTHLTSLTMGVQYPGNADMNRGVTTIFASPTKGSKGCDSMSLQVMPTVQSCEVIARSVVASRGRLVGDLAGIALMQNQLGAQLTLLPTAGNGCTVLAMKTAYAE